MAESWKVNSVSEADDRMLREVKAARILRGAPGATNADIIREGVRTVHRREVQGVRDEPSAP